jgi:putative ABC transport system permease protein
VPETAGPASAGGPRFSPQVFAAPTVARRPTRRCANSIVCVDCFRFDEVMVGTLMNDVRFAVRSFRRTPGFLLAAVLTLAIGIGANTAIFSAVHGVLLRPLPYADADRIHVLWLRNVPEGIERDVTSYPVFEAWREAGSFDAMAAIANATRTLTETDQPEVLEGALVTADYFSVFGVPALVGRTLRPAEMEPGGHRVVVLSYGFWQRRFGGDASLIGRTIVLNGEAVEVVGVMPPGFSYPEGAQFWMPLAPATPQLAQLFESAGSLWLAIVGRLSPGTPLARADAEMASIMGALRERFGIEEDDGTGVFIEPLRDVIVGDVRPALLTLLGAVGFVLLIACANVANLLLARGAGRQRELSIRTALGATGARLARQVLTESVVLAAAGGVLGVLLAVWGTSLLVGASPPGIPRLEGVGVNAAVLAFSAVVALATGVLFGLAPALQARATALGDALRDAARGSTSDRLARVRPVLLSAEIALALMLLVGAGLLLRSFAALQAVEPGFATERVLSFSITPSAARHATPEQLRAVQRELLERVDALGSVRAATGINTLLLSRLPNMGPVTIEGQPAALPGDPVVSVTNDAVEPGFFEAMGVPIVRGRGFGADDRRDGVPVAVVNETFARTFLAGEDPIGRRYTRGDAAADDAVWVTIIGVAADTRRAGVTAPVRPETYVSYEQFPRRTMNVLVRATREPISLVPEIRAIVRDLDPTLPIAYVSTLHQALAETVAVRRFVMQMLTMFAAAAMLLAAVGIYGVLSYMVGRRTRELGIRMALGASRGDVIVMVLRQALVHVLPGLLLGALGAFAVGRLLAAQLFGIAPTDALTFAAVATLLAVVALAASWAPAWRASRIEPMVTLKEE